MPSQINILITSFIEQKKGVVRIKEADYEGLVRLCFIEACRDIFIDIYDFGTIMWHSKKVMHCTIRKIKRKKREREGKKLKKRQQHLTVHESNSNCQLAAVSESGSDRSATRLTC